MPSLSSLTRSLLTQVNQRKADAYLIELSAEGQPNVDEENNPVKLAFQYFPESVSDTKAVNYQPKEIPGGSLPLYQWVSGGERLITFTVVFTCDVDLLSVQEATGTASLLGTASSIKDRLDAAGASRRNVDIRAAVGWLRRYMLPTYMQGGKGQVVEGTPLTKSPTKLRLVMPNSGIGLAGGTPATPDSVRCVMTQCDVTYEAFFTSGLPRIATVALAFAQVPQYAGFVEFPHNGYDMAKQTIGSKPDITFGYNINPKTKGGGGFGFGGF